MMFSNLRGIANLYPIYEGENESWERFNRIFELTEKLSPLFLVQVPRCNNLCKCWDDIAMFWKKNAFALSNTNFMYEAIYHIHNSRFSEKVEKSDALKLVLLIEDELLRCGYAFRVWKDMEAFIEPLRRILHTTTSNKKNKKTYSKTLEAYKKGRTMMLIMLKGMNEDAWGDRLDCQWAVYPYGLWRVQRDIESFEKAIDYLIEKQDMQVFFSHWHGCDLMVHTFIRYFQDQGYNKFPPEHINKWMERVYQLCDKYIGSFLHYLDEGWTIIVTSDHGLTCPTYEPPAIGDMCGINIGLMEELGYTVMKEGKGGKKEIDWTKTRAIAEQGGNIWINLKGRSEVGIVEPEDKYELEEQIMTDLLGYRHPVTGKRVLAVAMRNKDAIQLGYGGPTAGDIFTANADGYAYDHTDGLMTNHGVNDTSLAPIMILAGKGIKKGYTIERMIRQVDMAPTICALTGSRFTDTMEGAPIYCALEKN